MVVFAPILVLALTVQTAEDPAVQAVRLEQGEVVRVDGRLDEPVWARAGAATGLRQREPSVGAAATDITEVRIAFDGATLYVGVRARDAEPDRVIARILQRDRVMQVEDFTNLPVFAGDDAIAILLDPFHDHRNAVIFATNPNGAEFDALLTDEGREFNVDWRAIWEVAAARTPEGWSAEFAIPFRTLRYPAGGDGVWGFNVYRVMRRRNEEALWSGWAREHGFHRVSRAGHLTGLTDLPRAGRNIEVKPYVLAGVTQEDTGRVVTDPAYDVGLDAKWEVRPGLTLDVTANTDFAQVEADDQQVNLTRFSLFFPEKREFFLENSGVFEFGFRGVFEPPPFLLFFSRQIGIADSGAVPVLGGARLSGRIGGQTVGLLGIVTDDATFGGVTEPRTAFTALRVKRDIGGTHYVGAMVADRRTASTWNTVGGVDFTWWPTGAINVQGFAARTATGDGAGNDWAGRIGLDYTGDRTGVSLGYLQVGPDATADMGFVTRTDIRRFDWLGRVTPRPGVLGVRRLDLFAFGQVITAIDGTLFDWQLGPAVGPVWESGETVNAFALRGFTRLDESFEIREHDDPDSVVTVPAGDYDWVQAGVFASTSRNRPIVLDAAGSVQTLYDGHLLNLGGTLTAAPSANLSVALAYTHNRVDVPDGRFDADLASVRAVLALSTRLVVNALLQYNQLDRTVSANVRLNYIHRPGSDLFVVFNEQRGSSTSLFDFTDRGTVVKLTYLARL